MGRELRLRFGDWSRRVGPRWPIRTGMRSYNRYVRDIIRHPIGAGLAAVALVGLGILLVGSRLVTDSFLGDVEVRQARQGAHLSEAIHYSGLLGDDRDDARVRFEAIALSPEFDSVLRRAMFGLTATRFDVYALDGERVYSSDRAAPPEPAALWREIRQCPGPRQPSVRRPS